MDNIFELKICSCCKNEECLKNIIVNVDKSITSYKCDEYVKDNAKIMPYEKPLVVTAKRDYLSNVEF